MLTKCQSRQAPVATVTSVHLERGRKCDGVTGSTEAEGRGGKLAQVNTGIWHELCSNLSTFFRKNTQMKLCCGCRRRIRTCLGVWFWRAVTTCFCPLFLGGFAVDFIRRLYNKSYKWHNSTSFVHAVYDLVCLINLAAKMGRQKFFTAAFTPVFCWVIHPDSAALLQSHLTKSSSPQSAADKQFRFLAVCHQALETFCPGSALDLLSFPVI